MGAFTRLVFAIALVILGLTAFRLYRVKATAEEADQFAPAGARQTLIPAGTEITAVLRNGIAESATAGDPVRAFVSEPVVVNGSVVIAPGAQLRGELQEISISG